MTPGDATLQTLTMGKMKLVGKIHDKLKAISGEQKIR
jgi:hypothetical protein